MTHFYYNVDGEPISQEDWARLHSLIEYKRIAFEVFRGPDGDISVSTVWLGTDHSFGLKGPPIIFETMIFGGEHDQYQERYATLEEAKAGHERACSMVKESIRV